MLTFEQCKTILGNRTSKKLENNTYLVPISWQGAEVDKYAVRLHETNIVLISRDGYTLTTGGFQTVTTKDRLNKYGPVMIWQKGYVWYWAPRPMLNGDVAQLFQDGLTISSGELVGV